MNKDSIYLGMLLYMSVFLRVGDNRGTLPHPPLEFEGPPPSQHPTNIIYVQSNSAPLFRRGISYQEQKKMLIPSSKQEC